MSRFKRFTSVMMAIALLIFASPLPVRAANQSEYTIIHTNDMHGRMDSDKLARLKTFKDATKPLLMLDGGDAMQGLPVSNFSKGADMAKVMNAIGYDAMAVGNHEFDFGQAVASGKEEGFGSVLEFPLLSSNTIVEDTGKHLFDPSIRFGDVTTAQSHLAESKGLNIPIVGATTPETITKTHPNNIKGLKWEDPLPAVTKELLKYSDKNPDFYVVVSHLGTDKETPEAWRSDYLAEQLSKQDSTKDMKIVIVDGHSHSEENEKHGNVLLVQTGEHLNNVGVVTVNLDDWTETDGKLIKFDDLVKEYEPDPTVQALLDTANENFKVYGSKVVVEGNTVDFNGLRDFARTRETNLGNAITDSIMAYSESANDKADLAVVNGGGIRANLKPGNITLGDIISVLPFGNIYSLIEVTGQDLYDMFEHSVRTDVQLNEDGSYKLDANGELQLGAKGGFLHVSEGTVLKIDLLKPAGQRIVSFTIDGKPVDKAGKYKLATNDFLAVGGDGYTMLGGPRTEGPSLDTVFANFLEANKADLSKYADDTKQTRILKVDVVEEGIKTDELKALIAEGLLKVKAEYTPASFEPFAKSLESAQDLIATIEGKTRILITQETVDNAAKDLSTKMANLSKVITVDDSELSELISHQHRIDEKDYTKDSFANYMKAIKAGEALVKRVAAGDLTVTQAEIDAASASVSKAFKALVEVSKEGELPGTGIASFSYVPLSLIAAGASALYIAKRRRDHE